MTVVAGRSAGGVVTTGSGVGDALVGGDALTGGSDAGGGVGPEVAVEVAAGAVGLVAAAVEGVDGGCCAADECALQPASALAATLTKTRPVAVVRRDS